MMPATKIATADLPSRWRFPVLQAIAFIVLSAVLRMVLAIKFCQWSGVPVASMARIGGIGLLLDATVAAVLFLPMAVWLSLVPTNWVRAAWHRRLIYAVTCVQWATMILLFEAEYFFFEEYSSRFNTVALDYLHYWTEVAGNIGAVYPVKTVLAVAVLGALGVVLILRSLATAVEDASPRQRVSQFLAWTGAAAGLLWCATRVDPHASDQRLVNELASNGLTSGTIAALTRELDYAQFFPTLPEDAAFARARRLLDSPGAVWSADEHSLQRLIPGDATKPRLNLVVLVQESFGSEFWGCLNRRGGKGPKHSLTPHLDALAEREGLLFTNLLADGNRTVRGMEAIFASFPPLPGDAILARPKSNGLDTLGSVLGRDGYRTTFIYPGRGVFDEMGPFFRANGFERFIEGKDFDHPKFSTVWGHCDDDLYDRVLVEARAARATGEPFLIGTMSVSNHQPFAFPPGSVSQHLHGHKAGAAYSDAALGRFFEQARKEPFWNDTIFAVVADHGARVYGSQTVPVLSYEVPLLVLGPAAVQQSAKIEVPGCQLDVAPTLLGLIGRPYETVFYGRDLLRPAAQRFALLNHNRSVAIYREPNLIALSLRKAVERFTRVDRRTLQRQALGPEGSETADDATALFQTADCLYSNHAFAVQRHAPGSSLSYHSR